MSNEEARLYTLEEARVVLAREYCRRYGHDWQELKSGDGTLIMMSCQRCGLALKPVEGT